MDMLDGDAALLILSPVPEPEPMVRHSFHFFANQVDLAAIGLLDPVCSTGSIRSQLITFTIAATLADASESVKLAY